MGRGDDRTCPRGRPSPPGVSIRDGVDVLVARADRRRSSLQRGRTGGFEQWPRGGAIRHRGLPRWCTSGRRPTREVRRDSPCAPHGPRRWTTRRSDIVMALTFVGSRDDAVAAATGLIEAAETRAQSIRAHDRATGLRLRTVGSRARARTGRTSPGSGDSSRQRQPRQPSHLATALCRLEVEHGDPLVALDFCTLAVRNYHDAGNTSQLRVVLAMLAASLDRICHSRPAAIIAGFAVSALSAATLLNSLSRSPTCAVS